MATYTPNLNLKKPSTGEKYDVVADLNDSKDKLDIAIGNHASQLAESEMVKYSIGNSKWWKPETQPSFNNTENGFNADKEVPLNIGTTPYSEIITKLWDRFSNDPSLSGYATKTVLGKDQSGLYDMYKYVFTPENYEKTIILGAGLHGWERAGVGVLSRFMNYVCYHSGKNPQLGYLRNKVRIVVLPFENPHGYINGNARLNSRGVDLNRNFPYNWALFTPTENYSGGYDYKGTSAGSEKETQYIMDTLALYPDSVAYLDFHNMSGSSPNFYFYLPAHEANNKIIINEVFAKFKNQVCKQGRTSQPNAFNYASTLDMNSANPEFVVGAFSTTFPYGSYEMTRWLEFAGNLIIKYAEIEKPSIYNSEEPFTLYLDYTKLSGAGFISSTPLEYVEVPIPTYTFLPKSDGILQVDYNVSYTAKDVTSRNFFVPLIGQDQTNYLASKTYSNFEIYKDTMRADARDFISFNASIPVVKDESGQYARVGLRVKNTVGQMEVNRIRMRVTFIPSNGSERHVMRFVNAQGTWANV